MDLMGNGMDDNNAKLKKKVLNAIIVCSVLIVILIGILIVVNSGGGPKTISQVKLNIDGVEVPTVPEMFVFQDEKMYISISEMSKNIGYKFFYGEYQVYNEDKDRCYIENENEIATFYQGSRRIQKAKKEVNIDWEQIDLQQEVINVNGNLYVNLEGLTIACNLQTDYDVNQNILNISTLEYIYETTKVSLASLGSEYVNTNLASEYENKKALLDGIIVIIKDNKYGVLNSAAEVVVGNKYDKLVYNYITKEFVATDARKSGILSTNGQTKIKLEYDEIKLIDRTYKLWLIKNNTLYGILDKDGNVCVKQEYEKIGIDFSPYVNDKNQNGISIFNNIIPIMSNKSWKLYNKGSNKILSEEYEQIGYIPTGSNTKLESNILTIPEAEAIVVKKNGLYGLVGSSGNTMLECNYDKIYYVLNNGQKDYYIEKNGNSTKIEIGTEKSTPNKKTEEQNEKKEQDDKKNEGLMTGMDEQERNMFNQKYEQYEGEIKGTSVKSLISLLMVENGRNDEVVKMEYENIVMHEENDLQNMKNNIDGAKTYKVTLEYTNGRVNKINVK